MEYHPHHQLHLSGKPSLAGRKRCLELYKASRSGSMILERLESTWKHPLITLPISFPTCGTMSIHFPQCLAVTVLCQGHRVAKLEPDISACSSACSSHTGASMKWIIHTMPATSNNHSCFKDNYQANQLCRMQHIQWSRVSRGHAQNVALHAGNPRAVNG